MVDFFGGGGFCDINHNNQKTAVVVPVAVTILKPSKKGAERYLTGVALRLFRRSRGDLASSGQRHVLEAPRRHVAVL